MRIIEDGILLCSDCTMVACNGTHGIELANLDATVNGLYALGSHLVPAFDSETGKGINDFSTAQCRACGTKDAGYRAEFARLGE